VRELTVADSQGVGLRTPVTTDGVDIAGADTAALDLDVNVVVAEGLGVELLLVELLPGLGAVDLEAAELLGVRRHDG
jgi:hypothetical protein